MIRPAAEHDHFQELNHLHFRMVLSVISGMQGWYLAWLQDRFLSSVACNDEVSADGEAVGRSFFLASEAMPSEKVHILCIFLAMGKGLRSHFLSD